MKYKNTRSIWLLLSLLVLMSHSAYAQLISDTPITSPTEFKAYLLEHDSLFTSGAEQPPDSAMLENTFKHNVRLSGIVYKVDGLRIRGFAFKPKAPGQYPAVIYNRGGNRDFGSLTFPGSSIGPAQLAEIASWGYVVVASQYRGAGGSEGADHFGGDDVNDVLALPAVLAEFDEVDTLRIGLFGWSRGSMMSFLALKKGLKVSAVAVGGILADLALSLEHRPQFSKMFAEMDPQYQRDPQAWLAERSVLNWLDRLPKVPMLVLNGSSDWRTRSTQALKLVEALDEKRYPVRFIMYEGADHAISQYREEVFMQLRNWLDRYVRDQQPPPIINYAPKE